MQNSARLSTFALSAAAALALTACGSESSGEFTTADGETGEYTIDQSSGESSITVDTEDGEVSMRTGANVAIDLPAGFEIIGGAEILSNTVVDQADGKGSMTTFTTDKSPEEIADFYRAQAENAGIDIQIETSMNGGKMIGGENEAEGTTFSVTAYPGDDGTTGVLTISQNIE